MKLKFKKVLSRLISFTPAGLNGDVRSKWFLKFLLLKAFFYGPFKTKNSHRNLNFETKKVMIRPIENGVLRKFVPTIKLKSVNVKVNWNKIFHFELPENIFISIIYFLLLGRHYELFYDFAHAKISKIRKSRNKKLSTGNWSQIKSDN